MEVISLYIITSAKRFIETYAAFWNEILLGFYLDVVYVVFIHSFWVAWFIDLLL